MANMITGIISLTIGIVMLSGVFIATVKTTNTDGWETSEVALFGLLTLVGIAGLLYGVVGVFGLS